jgi:hypothetical protein
MRPGLGCAIGFAIEFWEFWEALCSVSVAVLRQRMRLIRAVPQASCGGPSATVAEPLARVA